ncbi:MAG TPA: threonine ammonia-lyase [Gordonia polyisoprenivorans]|uniref:threonine ammonia-lyase n=1 Tax=Gordonia polyisoprenivorans TaxID=84595 RepID=A0A846WJK8_9ACTN|nr:threonine ammonia-lyase [Gordonia polyisoprenivorans]NKY01359.1 threonine ammonia-lyase [Gordonia polyisoprenivorans]OZC29668.1 threonine ammonia-lyase [Gordonia polyisoprenivorans]QUD81378.1 threonine ammonia-lyase [Gordonia polyisoprenivorans]WCB39031.1 threonine ammonia-lyase [Gordonia polyisoprenivorans]GAB25594.1 putative threonine dehydratase [Gordonia polyisoprenivorans NBRC 16320 = JCM 10675]
MLITASEIADAVTELRGVMRRTPMVASRVLSERADREVWLKCENLQRTGSFKPRGAYYRISRLNPAERERGVVAASAGNHAQGVAWSASRLGISSRVYMPVGAALPKIAATRAYGAEVELVGATIDESLVAAREFAERTGAVLIHPFDHRDIVIGQATVGVEICEQMPDVGTIVVPLGGGGLLAGIAAAVKPVRPDVRIIGVQAAEAAAWPQSLAAGSPTAAARMATMADGIAVALPGEVPFAHVTELVDDVVTVDEDALATALLLMLERAKLLVEPAGAAGVAAVVEGACGQLSGPVCVVASGGNIDPLVLSHVTTTGLSAAGRFLTVTATVPDRPGGLISLLEMLRDQGASVVDVVHSRVAEGLALGQVQVTVSAETRGPDHQATVREALAQAGFLR